MKADLHVHSHYSDGSDSVEKIMKKAVQANLTHTSIVDHDTTSGWSDIHTLGNKYGMEVIPGIEISAYDYKRNRKVHILGYHYRLDAPHIRALCQPLLRRRHQNSLWQIDNIRAAGHTMDLDRIQDIASPSQAIYKQHIMRYLTKASYTSIVYQTFYKQLFKGNGIANRDIEYVDAFDAVKAIVSDGGIAVVAHPGQLNSYDIIPELIEVGLKGVELAHPDHTDKDVQRVSDLAEKYDLITTGGTDYHGEYGLDIKIGELTSPELPLFAPYS